MQLFREVPAGLGKLTVNGEKKVIFGKTVGKISYIINVVLILVVGIMDTVLLLSNHCSCCWISLSLAK